MLSQAYRVLINEGPAVFFEKVIFTIRSMIRNPLRPISYRIAHRKLESVAATIAYSHERQKPDPRPTSYRIAPPIELSEREKALLRECLEEIKRVYE